MEKRGQIEFTSACAIIIYELLKNKTPTTTTANLLLTVIFTNTLSFKSNITTKRDIIAYNKLKKHTDLPENWIEQYYNEVESVMFSDILSTIKNDTKILQKKYNNKSNRIMGS